MAGLVLLSASPAQAQSAGARGALPQTGLDHWERTTESADIFGTLRRNDPDALIALQLGLADIYAAAGRNDAAIAAYEQALVSILQFRGQGHETMIAPMTAVGRLASDAAVRVRWLETAQGLRIAHWGESDARLAPYAREIEAARTVTP